jgi:hypothetical protein
MIGEQVNLKGYGKKRYLPNSVELLGYLQIYLEK